ncbi:MAG: hypothetical protein A2Y86_01565 [Candidatus Aminicenantes bacterium RBG_13_62_12]|nr:MAG: hypothetical protein A2Y86_01565 [Candidatus Aminicenantes bacterium RBG_13_62_12]
MEHTMRLRAGLALTLLLAWALPVLGQAEDVDIEALKKTAPKVFIDCQNCDLEFIKTEVTFVNYVRDRKEADVHVLITTQKTGSEGKEHTLTFLGQNGFKGLDDIQRFVSAKSDTDDDIRRGLVRAMKIGLTSYVARTPIAQRVEVVYKPETRAAGVKDRWDSWVFNLGAEAYFSGESSYRSRYWEFSVSANRVTPALKIQLGLSSGITLNAYDYEGYTYESRQDDYGFSGLAVKSLGPHWSAGLYADADSSTYSNLRWSLSAAPAVEYNVFPYAQSTRRQLRFLYKAGAARARYHDVTIYGKTSETLWRESLSVTLELREKWGTVSASLTGSHYFHDFKKNRLNLFTVLNLNLFKGLSLVAVASGARIHDQISLPAGSASLEEILLQRREIETSYRYFVSFGLNFTFGSIYTNVVNPRFGSISSGGMRVTID